MAFPLRRRTIRAGWMLAAAVAGLQLGRAALPVRAEAELVSVANDYVLRVWETDDGLPQNTVTGIAQTPHGYLWLATQGGLVRFDGVRFTSYLKGTTPGLESSYARAVLSDRAGALWIGLERGGVARMQGGRFETILPVAPPTAETRWAGSFAEDTEGAVWIGMAPDQTVYRWQGGRLTKLSADDGVGPGQDTFVHADAAGRIWFATKEACGVFDSARFQPVDPQGGNRVHLAPSRDGGMWATRGQKLLRYRPDGGREEVADLAWLGGAVEITVLCEDRAGDLWLGTRGAGLLRFRAGQLARAPTSHRAVQAIFEDRDRNLWVGTIGGLNRLRPQRFFLRGVEHGVATEGVNSVCQDTEGRLWLAVRDSAPVHSVDAAHQRFVAPAGWTGGAVTSMCPDPSGGIWLGYDGGALQRWRDGHYSKEGPVQRVSTLLCDREGTLWIATMREGLVRFRDGIAEPEPAVAGLTLVRALGEDSAGGIWAGTEDGLVFRREDGRYRRIPLPETAGGEAIRFFVPDGDAMWIGARDAGLFRWRAGQIERLPADAGLPLNDFRALLIEPDGSFWLATGGSLFRSSRQHFEEVLAGRQRVLHGLSYGRSDGLPKAGFTFGRRNSAIRTRDGRIWFGTDRGPLEVSPEPLPQTAPLLPVLIEELRVDDRSIPFSAGAPVVLPPKAGPLEIRFTVPHLSAPERLRFRYRLAGLEKGWTPAENERTANYARLPPGSYRFEVAASEGDAGERPSSVATLPFTIRAAWWETVFFRIVVATLGALGVASLVRSIELRRVRARIRRLEQEHALEKERARIARDMHDDLGASLTRIALMSEIAADEPEMRGPAAHQLGEIAQAARAVSSTLDQIVWTVNPRNDTLERLVGYLAEFASEYLAPTGLNLHFDLPVEMPEQTMPAEARHEMLLATKEALNNIVKHAQAKFVTLRVTTQGQVLEVLIIDDGCGFDAETVSAFSNGLLNLRQRLAAAGGSADIASRPGAGTTVTLRLPLTRK